MVLINKSTKVFYGGKKVRKGAAAVVIDRDKDYAHLSKIAYEPDMQKRADAARERGYLLDKELSDVHKSVYVDRRNRAIVAYRGTKINDLEDLKADFSILTNQYNHPHFTDADEHITRVRNKYGSKIHLTGHSLGGTIADRINKKHGYAATIFNPGSNPLIRQRPNRNVTVHRNKKDAISSGYGSSGYMILGSDIPMTLLETAMSHGIKQYV